VGNFPWEMPDKPQLLADGTRQLQRSLVRLPTHSKRNARPMKMLKGLDEWVAEVTAGVEVVERTWPHQEHSSPPQ